MEAAGKAGRRRPGGTERLALGPDTCRARNPRLVYGRMTVWGQAGPLGHAAGHDLTYIAITGVLHGLGQTADRPQFPVNLLGDFGGGSTFLVIGVLSALLSARPHAGRGGTTRPPPCARHLRRHRRRHAARTCT